MTDWAVWSQARSGEATAQREGRWLASRFDPALEARRSLAAAPDEPGLVVLGGLGLGYELEAAVQRWSDAPVVVVDDPAWIYEVARHRDLGALWSHPRVTLCRSDEELKAFLEAWEFPVITTLMWRPGEEADPARASHWRALVAEAQARNQVNFATGRRFFDLWRRNRDRNEASLGPARPLHFLEGVWSGRPVVVAAAGPSLAEDLDWMGRYRDRFVLVAVDTAWSSLGAHGFVPDVVVALDGQYWNVRHLDRPLPATTLLVTEAVGPPKAFRLAPDRTFVAASSVPLLRASEGGRWGELGALPSGGSVATAAYSLARLGGASLVVFAGLDLGYPRGQTHVPGSQFEEAIHRRSHRLGPSETLGLGLRDRTLSTLVVDGEGRPLESDPKFGVFAHWLERSIAAHPELAVYRLNRRGRSLRGVEVLGPHVAEAWPKVEPWSVPDRAQVIRRPVPAGLETLGWESWAGRARRTWERWPSAATRAVLQSRLDEARRLGLEPPAW